VTGFPIFIVYGPEHVAHLKTLTIPSINRQLGQDAIDIYLLNYSSKTPLFGPQDSHGLCTIHDLSADKSTITNGFGEGMNFLFEKAQPSPCFLMLNPDTILDPHAVETLLRHFDPTSSGLIEARQWPSEHPKEYDKMSGETPWASGACLLAASDNYAAIGGFDPVYFMYCEDVDLSWQSWLRGRSVIYVPKAGVMHFTGLFHYRHDRYYREHFYSCRNHIVLAKKFFGITGEKKALEHLRISGYPEGFKEQVIKSYESIAPSVIIIDRPDHPMVKITGFNRYHH